MSGAVWQEPPFGRGSGPDHHQDCRGSAKANRERPCVHCVGPGCIQCPEQCGLMKHPGQECEEAYASIPRTKNCLLTGATIPLTRSHWCVRHKELIIDMRNVQPRRRSEDEGYFKRATGFNRAQKKMEELGIVPALLTHDTYYLEITLKAHRLTVKDVSAIKHEVFSPFTTGDPAAPKFEATRRGKTRAGPRANDHPAGWTRAERPFDDRLEK